MCLTRQQHSKGGGAKLRVQAVALELGSLVLHTWFGGRREEWDARYPGPRVHLIMKAVAGQWRREARDGSGGSQAEQLRRLAIEG